MVGDIGSIELDREGVPECRSAEAAQSDPTPLAVCTVQTRDPGFGPGTGRGTRMTAVCTVEKTLDGPRRPLEDKT